MKQAHRDLHPVGTAETIDGVLDRLDDILRQCLGAPSRLGYFTALYRTVTARVKKTIDEGGFDDGRRMEHLDVVFANRFLAAYDQWVSHRTPSASWKVAFDATPSPFPIVLQHLELGMNAHILLDLGIAAEEVSGPGGLASLHDDFNRINDLLADLVDGVKTDLAEIWAPLRWFNRWLGGSENQLVRFGMDAARNSAWGFAETLAQLSAEDRRLLIARRDTETAHLGDLLWRPGILLRALLLLIRIGERGSIVRKIEILQSVEPSSP